MNFELYFCVVPSINIHTHRAADGETTLSAAGIHPWQADEYDIADADTLRNALGSGLDTAQAIGETGLDFACNADRDAQVRLFRAHLQLAEQMRLPVVIHCVRAFEPVMKIIGEYAVPNVLFHGFVGSADLVRRAVEKGYFISFGLRSLRSPKSVAAMRTVPPELMFVETDDDDISIEDIYKMAAEAIGSEVETLQCRCNENYKKLTSNG